MARRWYMDNYEFKYNPSSDSRSMSSTASTSMNANGLMTIANDFYEKNISLSVDLYYKPSRLGDTIVTFSSDYYSSIAEDVVAEEIYALRGTQADIIKKGTGNLLSTISVDLASGQDGVAIAHLSDSLAIFYENGDLVICEENGAQISKYNYIDVDILNITSLTFMDSSTVFGLNKYGKIFSFNISTGESQLVFQSSDFDNNKNNNIESYSSIHNIDGYIGMVASQQIAYLNPSYEICFAVPIVFNSMKSITYNTLSGDFCLLQDGAIKKFNSNLSGIDLDKIKSKAKKGVVIFTDEHRRSINVLIKNIRVDRKRNMDEARYSLSIEGRII